MLLPLKHQFIITGGSLCVEAVHMRNAVEVVVKVNSQSCMLTLVMCLKYEILSWIHFGVGGLQSIQLLMNNRGQTLFAEPQARHLAEVGTATALSDSDTLTIQVPLELRSAYLVNQFRAVSSATRQET